MSLTSEVAIIVGLILICFSSSQYAGISFQLTRLTKDKFKNPTAKRCDWQPENQKFCKDTNSRCSKNCCWCTCDDQTSSTFDRRDMKCRNDNEIRSGCQVKFSMFNNGEAIKLIDLRKKSSRKIYWKYTNRIPGDELKTFNILSIASFYDGKVVKTPFLKRKPGELEKKATKNGNYQTQLEWDKVSKEYYGLMFRVNISYEIERKMQRKNKEIINNKDCFVFKSSGSIQVSLGTGKSTTTSESSTTSRNTASPGAKEGSSGDENDNTVVVSLVVVVCIALIVAVVLVVWWKRRKCGKASKENDKGTIITNTGANNPMIMSPMESIYAEADNSVNYPQEKEKDSNVYDYAEENLENNYTSLDMSKVEAKPVYQSLCNSNNQPKVTVGKTPTAEPLYHVVDKPETTQYPGGIHNVLDESEKNSNCKTREVSGRTEHEDTERVYSVLEECAAENCGRDDNPERVYSVLDNNLETDYLTILAESSEYEQPINPPVSDF